MNTHITIGGHKVSAGKTYSTSEVRTGDVWIDGKPIYRKVVTGTTPSSGGNKNTATGVTNGANARLVDGYIINSTELSHFTLNFYVNSSFNMLANISATGDAIFMMGTDNTSSTTNRPFVAIIEYTKTTD